MIFITIQWRSNTEKKCKLLFTDTDSLWYHIKTENVYEDVNSNGENYDFSDYPKTHFLHNDSNKKVIGKFKDEANGKHIIEFAGLRAKMYAFSTEEKTKSVAKVIKEMLLRSSD